MTLSQTFQPESQALGGHDGPTIINQYWQTFSLNMLCFISLPPVYQIPACLISDLMIFLQIPYITSFCIKYFEFLSKSTLKHDVFLIQILVTSQCFKLIESKGQQQASQRFFRKQVTNGSQFYFISTGFKEFYTTKLLNIDTHHYYYVRIVLKLQVIKALCRQILAYRGPFLSI